MFSLRSQRKELGSNPSLMSGPKTTPHGRLMLTVLGGLAEFERELVRARTDEGRKRAQVRGVRFGRKLKLTPHQITEAIRRREAGEALVEIGRSYNVSHSTISRL
ncbi:MAG TPA: recombinase family protein [Pseudolabrys sp.]|nr:recombinase family protein [Pseudolabrys sp.]